MEKCLILTKILVLILAFGHPLLTLGIITNVKYRIHNTNDRPICPRLELNFARPQCISYVEPLRARKKAGQIGLSLVIISPTCRNDLLNSILQASNSNCLENYTDVLDGIVHLGGVLGRTNLGINLLSEYVSNILPKLMQTFKRVHFTSAVDIGKEYFMALFNQQLTLQFYVRRS